MLAGTAVAHEGHTASGERRAQIQAPSSTHQTYDQEASELPSNAAVLQADRQSGSVPCSDDRAAGHASGTCCTIACHAALATPPVEPARTREHPKTRVALLTGMLEGRSGDRAERPPKNRWFTSALARVRPPPSWVLCGRTPELRGRCRARRHV